MLPFQCRGQGAHHALPSQQSRQLAQNEGAPSLEQAAANGAAEPAEHRGSTHLMLGGWLAVCGCFLARCRCWWCPRPALQGKAWMDVHIVAEQACTTTTLTSVVGRQHNQEAALSTLRRLSCDLSNLVALPPVEQLLHEMLEVFIIPCNGRLHQHTKGGL